ncbi:MAG TPA: hypothetical protein VKK79_07855, partial [Candidatus Lokiarchaeia archaeon]|nr:hypothetical protein [Candidatus Lokiarchaeia archaeon]
CGSRISIPPNELKVLTRAPTSISNEKINQGRHALRDQLRQQANAERDQLQRQARELRRQARELRRTPASPRPTEIKSSNEKQPPTIDEILTQQRASALPQPPSASGFPSSQAPRASLRSVQGSDMERGIQVLNRLTLPVGILILVIAGPLQIIHNAASAVGILWQVAAILCAVGALIVDAHFHKFVLQNDYSFRGIDLIIWGFIGCFGFGVGAIILAKGCLILFYTTQKESGFPSLSRTQWLHVIISRLNSNSVKVGSLIWVATFGPVVAMIAGNPASAYLLVFTNLGLFSLIIDAANFQRRLKGHIVERRNTELGLGMVVAGIIGSINYAMGVVLLLKGVAVVALSNMREQPPQQQVEAEVSSIPAPETGESQLEDITTPTEPIPAPAPTPAPQTPVELLPFPNAPTRVLTPAGAPLPIPPPSPHPAPSPAPTAQPGSGDNFENRAAIREYLNRVYTVLSSKVRDRVLKLDIPEQEKKEILDGLLYLMPDEQEQFIAELEELARKLVPEIIGRVMRLNLSKDQNEKLLQQLEYLSEQEQVEFVEELERAHFEAA